MRTIQTIVVAAVMSVIAVAGARPFRGYGGGGWGPGGAWDRLYDPKSVETVTGTVKSVDVVKSRGMSDGLHITLATGGELIPVHLGPVWYLEHQDLALVAGDKVTIRGSRITYQGKPALIAAEVTRGSDVLVLRNEQGFPRWAAWRHRPSSS